MSKENPAKLLPRLVALQHRDFRLIWFGQLISMIGTQMQARTVDWHVADLLKGVSYTIYPLGIPITLQADALGLGSLGLVRVIPIIIFALLGGMMADTFNRRVILLWTQSLAAVFAGILALMTLLGSDSLIAIYLLTAALAATGALDNPARQSLLPNIVPPEHLSNAVSLNTLMWEVGAISGPALAGVLIGFVNIGSVYAVNAISYIAVVIALLLMSYRGQALSNQASGLGWDALRTGLRFVWNARLIRATMLLDFWATFFSSARSMLPLVARDILHTDAVGFGFLSTAQAAGSVIAGLIVALRKETYHQGAVLLISVAMYGLATALFGVTTSFALAYVFYALTGASDTVSTVIRSTLRQLLTPDHLRGRMTAVNQVFFMGGPQLGELEAGVVASAFGVPFAIVTGGIATMVFTLWTAWCYPRLRNYTSDQFDEVAAEMLK
jgi:MFS family permease